MNDNGERNGRRSNIVASSPAQRLFSATSRRRRHSVSPSRTERNSSANTSNSRGLLPTRASSSNPNTAFVTPSGQQRLLVRDLIASNNNDGNNSFNLTSFLAPDLTAPDNRNASSSAASSNEGIVNNRPSGTSASNNDRSNAQSAPTTPTSSRRRLLKNFRQGSIGSLLLGPGDNNNDIHSNKRNNGLVGENSNAQMNETAKSKKQNSSSKSRALKVRKHHILQMTRRLQKQHSKRYPHADILAILEFWRSYCPAEVTLKIFAFLGPQMISQLQRTQRNIHYMLKREVSWRVLCEELYKWRPGDKEPESWKEHYRVNPCVPMDFSSIGLAMAVVGSGWSVKQYKRYYKAGSNPTHCPEMQSNVTIWLRPDFAHSVNRAISVSTLRRSTQVTIRTMHTREKLNTAEIFYDISSEEEEQLHQATNQPEECYPGLDGRENNNQDEEESEHSSTSDVDAREATVATNKATKCAARKRRTRALLKSKTRRRNEPIIRVLRGQLILQDVELEHSCLGTDIWNGNAAIHIQPSYLHASGSILALIPSASAVIHNSIVQSVSGRGIVTVDGGQLFCEGLYVHDCAATGVYVGGRGSCATLSKTDIWNNGTGNQHVAGGIARGHSGIYVEQSKRIELNECTVAYNTSSGISMIGNPLLLQNPDMDLNSSAENSFSRNIGLFMTNSHVLSNGCSPIDLPHTAFAGGELPSQHQFPWMLPQQKNRIGDVGVPEAKSIALKEELRRKKLEAQQKKN